MKGVEQIRKFLNRKNNTRETKVIPLRTRDTELVSNIVLEPRQGRGTFGIFKSYDIYVARIGLDSSEGRRHPVPRMDIFPVVLGGEFLSQRAAEKVFAKKAQDLITFEERFVA
jgi:hypothetical protein